jgi:outer membrane immunogenic protein
MKKLAIGIALLATSMARPVLAADLPVKAVPYVAPEYNWSGLYGGINGGWIGENETYTLTNPVPATPPTSSPHNIHLDNGIFGAHIGAQYQFSHVVIGAEAAASWPTGNDFGTSSLQCTSTVGSLCQARVDHVYTAGGRLGWAWDRLLLFASGGYAQTEIESQQLTHPPTVFDTTHADHNGYYVGGGVEYAFAQFFVAGIEYQHIFVDTAYHASTADGGGPSPPGVNGRNINGTDDIVRVRVSVKFGPDMFPIHPASH